MTKKLILSIIVCLVAILGIGATVAFYSDRETSANNRFVAGAIDLTTEHDGTYNGAPVIASNWKFGDPIKKFFDFDDVKPGDSGKQNLKLKVSSNEAWACVNIKLTESGDNGVTEPELQDPGEDKIDGKWNGELDQELNYIFWADNGDGIHQANENIIYQGKANSLPKGDNNTGLNIALTDSVNNNLATGGMKPGQEYKITAFWCIGDVSVDPITSDFVCDGTNVGNKSQTDSLYGDITFYAVQKRNNPNFKCADAVIGNGSGSTGGGSGSGTGTGGQNQGGDQNLSGEGMMLMSLSHDTDPLMNQQISGGETKPLVYFNYRVLLGDISIKRFDIFFNQNISDTIEAIYLYEGNNLISQDLDVTASDVVYNGFSYQYRFSGLNHYLSNGKEGNFSIRIKARNVTASVLNQIRVPANAVRYSNSVDSFYEPSASFSAITFIIKP